MIVSCASSPLCSFMVGIDVSIAKVFDNVPEFPAWSSIVICVIMVASVSVDNSHRLDGIIVAVPKLHVL